MAYLQPDAELLSILQSVSDILKMLGLSNSTIIVNDMITELSTSITMTKVSGSSITSKFRNLQTEIKREFGTSTHRKNVMNMLTLAHKNAVTTNLVEVMHVVNEPNVIEITNDRTIAYGIMNAFYQIIMRGSKNNEEKMIGLSFLYLNLVDGVFRNSLRTCLMWEQLSHIHPVDTTTIWNIDIHNIRTYFTTNSLDLSYFMGWNSTIRNAVGHSTFHFDSLTNKMIYEDRRAGRKEQLTVNELEELVQMLFNVFETVLLLNQISRVNDVCDTLVKRYP